MSEEITQMCKCGNTKFFVIEGTDPFTGDYVYLVCTECKENYGVSASNYGDIITDIPNTKED